MVGQSELNQQVALRVQSVSNGRLYALMSWDFGAMGGVNLE